ncbi:MAG TPA: urea carboxylase, partial [Acinetobacter sp.]|nr:urea carboxylase [Acinetobacter sp.]
MTALQQFEKTVLDQVCPAGEAWMCEVKQGQYFRIIDLEGNQAVDTFLNT